MDRQYALLTVWAVLIVGCSDGNGDVSTPTQASVVETVVPSTVKVPASTGATPETTTVGTTGPGPVISVSQDPGTAAFFEGALSDTTVTECDAVDNGWTVKGTVRNPLDTAASYRIYVSFLQPDGTTAGLLQIDVPTLDVGASVDWAGMLPIDGESINCVLRVERTRD